MQNYEHHPLEASSIPKEEERIPYPQQTQTSPSSTTPLITIPSPVNNQPPPPPPLSPPKAKAGGDHQTVVAMPPLSPNLNLNLDEPSPTRPPPPPPPPPPPLSLNLNLDEPSPTMPLSLDERPSRNVYAGPVDRPLLRPKPGFSLQLQEQHQQVTTATSNSPGPGPGPGPAPRSMMVVNLPPLPRLANRGHQICPSHRCE